MAKKVVATLKKEGQGKDYVKVVRTIRSPKTGAYSFKEEIITSEALKDYFKKG